MSPATDLSEIDITARQVWIAVLASADYQELEKAWGAVGIKPAYRFLRLPETGLIMVKARTGGTGVPFNLGEMTVTRCTIQTEQNLVGTAYVPGRNKRHAELAAVLDALLQDSSWRTCLLQSVIHPLKDSLRRRKEEVAKKAKATRVQFFTMVRGE